MGEGAFWIIADSGTLADFLPENEWGGLIKLHRYNDRGSWERAISALIEQAKERFEARFRDMGWEEPPFTYESERQKIVELHARMMRSKRDRNKNSG